MCLREGYLRSRRPSMRPLLSHSYHGVTAPGIFSLSVSPGFHLDRYGEWQSSTSFLEQGQHQDEERYRKRTYLVVDFSLAGITYREIIVQQHAISFTNAHRHRHQFVKQQDNAKQHIVTTSCLDHLLH